MNPCILIPCFDHAASVMAVASAARAHCPVVIVDDGSTVPLAEMPGCTVVRLERNCGKGAALCAGFKRAGELGFSHAITMDADGQHFAADLPKILAAAEAQPNALIVGVRDFYAASCPVHRRRSNAVSTFWFRIETGVRLGDSQCGFRCYPLALTQRLKTRSGRFAFELEFMVRASWVGAEIVAMPVQCSYKPDQLRLSHFRPLRDLAHITIMNIGLVLQSWFVPRTLRVAWSYGERRSLRKTIGEFFAEHAHDPLRLSLAVGLGLFFGIAPIWGYQMIAAAAAAHFLRLNKAITLVASNISIPPMMPFIFYGALALGHWLFTGHKLALDFSAQQMTKAKGFEYLWQWFMGSLVLAVLVSAVGTVAAYGAARWGPPAMKLEIYTRLYLWMAEHRRLVLGATLLITVVSLVISSRIDLEEDVLAILPQHDQIVDEYQYAIRKFRQIDRAYFDVGISTADPEKLNQAADELYAALATNQAYARITYRIEIQGQDKVVHFLTGSLPNLFTEADAKALSPKLEPAAMREYLGTMRRKLAGLEGMVLKDVVAADPIGMSSLVVAKVLPLQTGFNDAQLVDGRITSGDGRHVLLLAEPKLPSSNSGASAALVDDMLRLATSVEKHFPGAHVAITGGHRMTVDNAQLIKSDATRCIFLGMAAMLVLCLTAYRRRWLALLTFLPSLFGTLIAGVVLTVWQHHLSAIATGFATIAIGITVDYAIYVIYHLDNAAGLDSERMGRHVGRLVLPITVGALTTVAAFLVMATSPMHGYQQLGIFGAVGVFFSAAFALLILPLLVPIPKQSGQSPLWLTRLMERFHEWQAHGRPWLLVAVLLLSVVTVFGARRLRFEGDITKLNGITESTRSDEELIRKTWGDALGMTLVVARGATEDAALAQNDRAAEILSHAPGVTGVYSLAAVCPSRADQEMNIRRWREFWTPARRVETRGTLQQIGGELGFRPDAFASFWQRLDENPHILTLEDFHGTPLEQALNERVALAPGDNAVSTLLKVDDHAQIGRLREKLSGMILLDKKNFAEHIAYLAKEGLGRFALWTGILVTVIVYFSLGSIELVVATLLPLAFALLWTFGVMGWLGLPIDMMNSVFVIFIIGIGEDYSVFMMTSKLDEWRGRPQRLAATSASVVISALTTIFGFAVLVFARHPVLFSMGTTVLIGMVFAFAATLILTPFFMDILLFKEQPRGAPRWWHLIGTVWAGLHLGGSEAFLYGILRPCLKLVAPATADDKLRRATRWMARGVVKGLPFGRLEFRNISAETFAQPCIVISNHQSAVDVMLIVSLPGDVRQTAKKRIFDTPILGIGCKLLGHIMVEPNDPQTTLRRCREKLAEGASVHFYPEGTRSTDGFIQRFHRGAFELAVELRQEILPVLLCDTNTAMPRDSYWFEPYHVTVAALPRITPKTFDYSQGSVALTRHCEAVVREALQKQLDELNTPRVLRRKVERLYRYQGKFVEQFVHWKMKTDPMFGLLDSSVKRNGFVLDLGCGYGLATHWLAHTTDQRTFLGVDYDENKIRVAQRTAPQGRRVKFELRDILNWEYPPCDTVLLLDVLHYWTPEKQEFILSKARRALRPGGRLILREAARQESAEHRRVERWERFATRVGHNQTQEGLHFLTATELMKALKRAGFVNCEIKNGAGTDSNILLTASVNHGTG